jgi:hypothetical protein
VNRPRSSFLTIPQDLPAEAVFLLLPKVKMKMKMKGLSFGYVPGEPQGYLLVIAEVISEVIVKVIPKVIWMVIPNPANPR